MQKNKIYWKEIGVTAEYAIFAPSGKVEESHVILHIEPQSDSFTRQMERIYEGERLLHELPLFKETKPIFKRYFLSDATNQQPLMRQETNCSVSMIQQPPLDGSKVAVWIYLQKTTELQQTDGTFVSSHNGYQHIWTMGLCDNEGNSAQQTDTLLNRYENILQSFGATLADNCIRTWFFVRDVDTQYAGLVKARKDFFTKHGLTEHTHYISSTGIGGLPADTKALVQLGAYAITGFQPEQQTYLYAPTHLNPTYEYGVTFERGTVMRYGDRRHVFISGTASIDNKGEVVHVGDIINQTERMWENVEMLLKEGETSYEDVTQIIVYLRDTADFNVVKAMFDKKFPDIPTVITLAPVCRPTWLIEMECIAIKEEQNEAYNDF